MASLGSYLSGLRAARGVSLEEMARSTRVSRRYLEALETDDHAELPAAVFTRGFIRAYCQTLEEPCEEALGRYAEQTGEKPPATHRADAMRGAEREGGARSAVFVSLVLLVVLGAALFALTFALQGGSRSVSEPKPTPGAKPPAVDPADSSRFTARTGDAAMVPSQGAAAPPAMPQQPASPPEPGAAPPAVAAAAPTSPTSSTSSAPSAASTAPPASSPAVSPYRLVARASEKTWVRISTEDGRAVAEEVIPAGERREWLSNRRFVVTIGNAGGIDFELNGRSLPRLGPSGEVVRKLVIPAEER